MRKIIVGIDLSPESETAAAHAVDRARRDGAELVLTLVDVVPDPPMGLTPRSGAAYENLVNEQIERDRRGLDDLRARWAGSVGEMSQLVVHGLPDEALPRVATEIGADLIVVGSHGRTGLKRVLLGSIAERVIRLAPCSVLVARGDAPTGGYRRIVVGTDFTASAKLALRRAMAAAAPGARLDLVHCWRLAAHLPSPIDSAAVVPPSAELLAHAREALEAEGAKLVAAARDGTDLDVHFHAIESPPTHGVADFARAGDADLIVVGSHGRRGVKRFIIGSVAEVTARHAPCATLVARE